MWGQLKPSGDEDSVKEKAKNDLNDEDEEMKAEKDRQTNTLQEKEIVM